MPELTPLDDNRQEHFLNGEDLEPITRREHFYAGREGELPEGHQEPETREEWFIKKYRGGGGGDITVESLSVTSNGTYTAPSGKAYSPVEVDVPLPQNAYLLKSVTTPTAIASFNDGEEMVMPTLKVAIEPQQEGSGDPSPTNVRPISGWGEVNVTRCGKNLWDRDNIRRGVYTNGDGTTQSGSATTNFSSQFIKIMPNTTYSITMFGESYENGFLFGVYYDEYKNGLNQFTNILKLVSNESKTFTTPSNAHYVVFSGYRGAGTDIFTTANTMVCEGTPTTYEPYNGQTYTIDLDGTRYGGELDVVSGIMTVDKIMFSLNGSENWATDIVGNNKRRFTCIFLIDLGVTTTTTFDAISNIYVNTKSSSYTNLSEVFILRYLSQYNQNRIDIMTEAYQDVASFKAFLNSTNMQIVYELATPLTIQLTPTAVKSLLGSNNVWADSGQVQELSYFSKEV